jgi:hypothetical protein
MDKRHPGAGARVAIGDYAATQAILIATAAKTCGQIAPGAPKTCRVIGFDCALPFMVQANVALLPSANVTDAVPTTVSATWVLFHGIALTGGAVTVDIGPVWMLPAVWRSSAIGHHGVP